MEIVITGGAGFIGCNSAEYYAKRKNKVIIVDNLSRKGGKQNVRYLLKKYPQNIKFIKCDLSNKKDINKIYKYLGTCNLILHLSGQVAVTTSITKPYKDFESNLIGTLNLLELLRKIKKYDKKNPILIYSSTNKVYGNMEQLKIIKKEGRYAYQNLSEGINEKQGLDFHSPYGCSKGSADQYVRDYSRIYGLNTIVMRQSCIYGRRQFGVEDQGWVAWFIIAKILEKQITIYGDGNQVRDILWIEDLIKAYDLARKNIKKTKGQIYNIGGGPKNTLSLNELINNLNENSTNKTKAFYSNWRQGDQKVCILNISKAKKDFGWEPKISPQEGIKKLFTWVNKNKKEVSKIFEHNN